MKLLLKLLGSLAALLLVLTAIGFLLPSNYHVQRSTTIHASADLVYTYVGDLRRWKEWAVWYQRDPEMKTRYSERTDTLGSWSEWETKGGGGKIIVTRLEPPTRIGYRLGLPHKRRTSNGLVEVVTTEGGVNVTLSDDGDLGNNPVSRWFGLFRDQLMGPDFEASLINLKKLNEGGS